MCKTCQIREANLNIKLLCYLLSGELQLLVSSVISDGPAEDLYGIFINRVRRDRPPEYLEKVRG